MLKFLTIECRSLWEYVHITIFNVFQVFFRWQHNIKLFINVYQFYFKKHAFQNESRRTFFFFEEPASLDQWQNVRHACNIYQCRGLERTERENALSDSILFLPGYLFAVSPTRDRIIVSIDPSRSIALEGSSLQVFNTHRGGNRWSFKWFSRDAMVSMKRWFGDFFFVRMIQVIADTKSLD